MRLAHAPAGQHHAVTRRIAGIIRRLDHPGKVNSRHMRVIAHQTAAARRQAQPILVIQRRIFDRHRHLACRQSVQLKGPQMRFGPRITGFLHHQGLKTHLIPRFAFNFLRLTLRQPCTGVYPLQSAKLLER